MAVVFMDGFDMYNGVSAPGGVFGKWTGTAGGLSVAAGRFGGQCCVFLNNNTNTISATFSAAVSSMTVGFSFKANSGGDTDQFLSLFSGATHMLGLRAHTDGSWGAFRATTGLGSSAASVFTTGQWYTIECEIVIHDTTGSFKVYQDGTLVLNLTGQDTRNGTPTTVDTIKLGAQIAASLAFSIDDLYVTDSATKPANAQRIETIYPNADGATLNFTPSTGTDHFAVVDETTVSTADYLQGTNVGDLDELELGSISVSPTAITAVNAVGFYQKTDVTARTMCTGVKSGGTVSDGSAFTLTTTGGRFDRILSTDPNTSTAWTESAVNALKIRPKVVS